MPGRSTIIAGTALGVWMFCGLAGPAAAESTALPPTELAAAPAGWRATRMIGAPVRNLEDEAVGSVVDLLLQEDGRLTALVLGVGGFLGVGTKYVAVPASTLRFLPGENGTPRLVVPMTREVLRSAPAFDLDADTAR